MSVITETHERVQSIRFNRPDKKNAITREMYQQVVTALTAGEASADVRVHLLLGSGGTFTAGNDIADFVAMASGDVLDTPVVQLLRLLPTLRKPLVAAADGAAVGIGTTILFHCDLVYAGENAQFAAPFLNLGLVPEAASSVLMPARMGHVRAFEMLALGRTLGANEAVQAGFVNQVVASDQLETEALIACVALAGKAPEALRATRALMRGPGYERETLEVIERELVIFAERLRSGEAREAFSAFLEKRAPRFGS